jgi:hypothetical protein
MLVAFVHSEAAAAISGEHAALIEKAARQRQAELREAARPRGERLFAEPPKRLRRSVGVYWQAAAALKEHELDEAAADRPLKRIRRQSAPRRRVQGAAKAGAKGHAKAQAKA